MDISKKKINRIKESWKFNKDNYVTIFNINFDNYNYNYAYLYFNDKGKLSYFCICEKPYITKDGDYTKQLFNDINNIQVDLNLFDFLVELLEKQELKINIYKYNNEFDFEKNLPIKLLTNFTHRLLENDLVPNINNNILIEYKKFLSLLHDAKHSPYKVTSNYKLIIGQKLKPLTKIEFENENNINYSTWKELIILENINKIIKICPFFYYLIDWAIIHGTNADFYNNINIKQLYHNSEKLNAIIEQSNDFIYDTLNKVLMKSILSNSSIVFFTEYVGKILKDSDELDNNIVWYFSLIYALYCLNTKCGIIHGDISDENIAIQNIIKKHTKDNSVWKFNINNDTYYFQNKKYTILPILLDYSKSIIGGDGSILEDTKQEFSDYYNKKYITKNIDNLLSFAKLKIPNIINNTNENQIYTFAIKNPQTFFNICTTIDYIDLSNLMYDYFKFPLCNKIKAFCIEHIINCIEKKECQYSVGYYIFDFFKENLKPLKGEETLVCTFS